MTQPCAGQRRTGWVGINATRALTCKYNAQLSCGRVQTPTLAMIAKREAQIRAFVPQPYFGLQARKDGLVPCMAGCRDRQPPFL